MAFLKKLWHPEVLVQAGSIFALEAVGASAVIDRALMPVVQNMGTTGLAIRTTVIAYVGITLGSYIYENFLVPSK